MSNLEEQNKIINDNLLEMWLLVNQQIDNVFIIVQQYDEEAVHEILYNEKRINSMELSIDRLCENIIALHSPLASDLRYLLACIKINLNLERLSDLAAGIAQIVLENKVSFSPKLLEKCKITKAAKLIKSMMHSVLKGFINENTEALKSLFKHETELDLWHDNAKSFLEKNMQKDNKLIKESLHFYDISIKAEKIGDQIENIGEEVIFFIEAKVLKHQH